MTKKVEAAVERDHALLAASSSKRWINCPPSARIADSIPEKTSDYAEEGTLAHSLSELKLRRIFTEPMTEKAYKSQLNKMKKNRLWADEMERCSDAYVEYIQKIAFGCQTKPSVSIEKKVDYSHVAKEGFGTSDCIILYGTTLHVIDYKHGKGIPVSAVDNPQMSLYAIGAMKAYEMLYNIEEVHLHVIQPRLNNFSAWTTTAAYLKQWAEEVVRPAAELAFKGEGYFTQGDWCDGCFCPIAGSCRARMEENMQLESYISPVDGELQLPPVLSSDEVGKILVRAQNLAKWVKKLEGFALDELMKSNPVPGWKLVEGRSNRQITDIDAAFKELQKAGYKKAMLYEPKPIPLTGVEALITKEDYNGILANYIEKPKGAPTLALETDKRKEYQIGTTAAEDFGGENSYKEEN